MAIVHVGEYAHDALNGVSATVAGQCDALHREGVALEIWNFDSTITEVREGTTQCGIPLFQLPRFQHPLVAASMLPATTRQWIKSRRAEIHRLHLHSVFVPSNNLLADLGIPYIVTPNGGWGEGVLKGRNRFLKSVWIALREKKLWSRAQAIQAVSESEARELAQLPGMARIIYIPNGVEIPPLKQIHGARAVWLYLGRFAVEHKGLDRLISSYARCLKSSEALPKLVLAGPDFREGKTAVLQMIAEHALEDHVVLRDPVVGEEKGRLFGEASLFVHTSRWDGMPLSVLEAMAHGLPCLVTEGTNMVPVIREFDCGFPAGDSLEEIQKAMILAQESNLKGMGARARHCVEEHFSWSSVAAKLMSLYELGTHDPNVKETNS